MLKLLYFTTTITVCIFIKSFAWDLGYNQIDCINKTSTTECKDLIYSYFTGLLRDGDLGETEKKNGYSSSKIPGDKILNEEKESYHYSYTEYYYESPNGLYKSPAKENTLTGVSTHL